MIRPQLERGIPTDLTLSDEFFGLHLRFVLDELVIVFLVDGSAEPKKNRQKSEQISPTVDPRL